MPKHESVKMKIEDARDCDLCQVNIAEYDGATNLRGPNIPGPWANMCRLCFAQFGIGLGLGRGQKYIYS